MNSQQRRVALVAGCLALGSSLVLVVLVVATDLDTAAAAATALAVPVAVVAAWLAWAAYQGSGPAARDMDLALAHTATELATAVRAQRRTEAEVRRIYDPLPLPVRWVVADEGLMDRWVGIRDDGRDEPLYLAGALEQIASVFARVPSGRLVMLGQGGAGKTVLASQFALELLAAPDVGTTAQRPVPIIFPLASWDPSGLSLRDWMIHRLIQDYPYLSTTVGHGATLASRLLDDERILPILDGFDELAEGLQTPALAALSGVTRFLLTSRIEEYAGAVRVNSRPLRAAAVVSIVDLSVADLVRYLPRTTGDAAEASSKWDSVLERLEQRAGHEELVAHDAVAGNLRAVLSTPLMVSLARAVYSDTPADPTDLLDRARFPDSESIEHHLLDRFVPAVYGHVPSDTYHHPRKPPAWNSSDVHRWLCFLAGHLNQLGTRDFAWWQLHRAVSRVVVVGVGLAGGILFGLIVAPVFALVHGWVYGLTYSLSAGGFMGMMYALVYGFFAGAPPSTTAFRIWGRRGPFLRWRFAAYGFAYGVASGLTFGTISGLASWVASGSGLASGISVGLASGLVVGLLFGILSGARKPINLDRTIDPRSLLRTDRMTTLIMAIGGSPAISRGFMAWGRYAMARIWLAATGRLPWRLMLFLEDAHQHRGVLRQAGSVYQFRHSRLQDRLAGYNNPAKSAGDPLKSRRGLGRMFRRGQAHIE